MSDAIFAEACDTIVKWIDSIKAEWCETSLRRPLEQLRHAAAARNEAAMRDANRVLDSAMRDHDRRLKKGQQIAAAILRQYGELSSSELVDRYLAEAEARLSVAREQQPARGRARRLKSK